MTKIKIYRQNQNIVGFECSGHSGYAEEGSDIVCAGISTLTLTCVLGLEKVVEQNISVARNDSKGYLKVMLKSNANEDLDKSQIIFKTMILGLKEIEKAYKKYLKLEDDYEIF